MSNVETAYAVVANEGIFDTVVSDFTNMLELIGDVKGTTNWYDTVSGSASLVELRDRSTIGQTGITLTASGDVTFNEGIKIGTVGSDITKFRYGVETKVLTSGTATAATIAHGLGVKPSTVIATLNQPQAGGGYLDYFFVRENGSTHPDATNFTYYVRVWQNETYYITWMVFE